METCTICGRPLNVDADPMSGDCGGDCWGCIGHIEAEAGFEPSIKFVQTEIEEGHRYKDGSPKPPP